jgi:hypothetical protein
MSTSGEPEIVQMSVQIPDSLFISVSPRNGSILKLNFFTGRTGIMYSRNYSYDYY